jgi:hypothetical protein
VAKKKSEELDAQPDQTGVFPPGAHFGVIQLPIDLLPKPSAQRIVQFIHDAQEGRLRCYITENAYHRAELITHFDKLLRRGYETSISKGAISLNPLKTKLHWCEFTEEFCKTGKGPRIDPETNAPEQEK